MRRLIAGGLPCVNGMQQRKRLNLEFKHKGSEIAAVSEKYKAKTNFLAHLKNHPQG